MSNFLRLIKQERQLQEKIAEELGLKMNYPTYDIVLRASNKAHADEVVEKLQEYSTGIDIHKNLAGREYYHNVEIDDYIMHIHYRYEKTKEEKIAELRAEIEQLEGN